MINLIHIDETGRITARELYEFLELIKGSFHVGLNNIS